MHRVFRLRHLVTMAVLMLLGALPVYAVCRPLGAADNFAVLAPSIVTTNGAGTTVNVLAVPTGAGDAEVGANTFTPNPPNLTAPGGIRVGTAEVTAGLTDLGNIGSSFITEAQTGTPLAAALSGTLTPGVYLVSDPATLAAGTTLTLNGAGDYLIAIDATTFTIGNGATIALTNGANAANVTFLVNGATTIGTGSTLNGRFISAFGTTVNASTINGRLYDLASLTFAGGASTINDVGAASTVTFTPALPANRTLTVAVGQTLNLQVAGTDPDASGTTQLAVSSTPALPGSAVFTPGLPQTGANASSALAFTPVAGQEGTYQVTLTVTDQSGAVCTENVTIVVTPAGTGGPTFVGATPAQGTTLVACPGQPLNFTVATAGAVATDQVALSVTGAPAGTVFNPTLPTTAANATTQVTFTPTAGQIGQTFPLVFSAQVGAGTAVTRTVNVQVVNAPVATLLTAGGGTITGNTINGTVGQQLQFRIRGTDADTGDAVTITASGAPAGGTFTPTLPASGNPAESLFTFTPTATGTQVITFTLTDASGCITTQTVNLNIAGGPGQVATLTFARTPTGDIGIGQEVCFTATARNSKGQPVANVPVTFNLDPGTTGATLRVGPLSGGTGATGTTTQLVVNTNKKGLAQVCFTPLAEGTATLTATSGGISAPVGSGVVPVGGLVTTLGAHVKGAGIVDASGLGFDFLGAPLDAQFNLDLSTKPSGRIKGSVNVYVPGPPDVEFRGRATQIDLLSVTESAAGRAAVVTGIMETNQFGPIDFRLDILDAGTPGVPSDRFVLTLDPLGAPLVIGGNLKYYRNDKAARFKHDIAVRLGRPSPGIKR